MLFMGHLPGCLGLQVLQSVWLAVEWQPIEAMAQSQPPCTDGGLVVLASYPCHGWSESEQTGSRPLLPSGVHK